MATKLEDEIDPAELYEADFYAWSKHQAETLRRFQTTRPNLPLDFEHLIEEVEDLGENRVRGIKSQLRRLMLHLLKLEHSPAIEPRRLWLDSVDDARAEIETAMTTSIRKALEGGIEPLYRWSRRGAARELRAHDEPAAAACLPETCPYTLDQLLDETWRPTSRHGLIDETF
jgi:hypothetical protein